VREVRKSMRRVIASAILIASIFRAVSLIGVPSPRSAWAAERYDLGGPCSPVVYPGTLSQIREAKKSGSWDRVIELAKLNVRDGCSIEYRWRELANALLEARRQTEALQAIQEMDSRGFDLSPSMIGREHEKLKDFMETQLFKTSPIGMKLEQLKRISDERRARYREALKGLPPDQKPPENYVAKGVCPFECCRYGNWPVLKDTDLVASPESKRVVGKAMKGSRAVGLTGEVHLKPEPVVVLVDGDLPKDSIAFVLDYVGEGFGHVYTRGRVVEVSLGYADYCFRLSESCWGETLLPSSERKGQVWWVKVRLASGVTGWTDKADSFGDKDACG
jgi:hypothetical protein